MQFAGDINNNQCGLFFRSSNPNTLQGGDLSVSGFSGYMLNIEQEGAGISFGYLDRWNNGVVTSLDSGSNDPNLNGNWAIMNKIKVKCTGNRIEIYFNDAQIRTIEDTSDNALFDGYVELFAHGMTAFFQVYCFDYVKLWASK